MTLHLRKVEQYCPIGCLDVVITVKLTFDWCLRHEFVLGIGGLYVFNTKCMWNQSIDTTNETYYSVLYDAQYYPRG